MVEVVTTEYPSSPHFKDRSGQIINGIEIIEYIGQDKNLNSVYRCKCPFCGNVWEVRMSGIIGGKTKGCGCAGSRTNQSINKWEDHIGEIHNQLEIIGFERVWSGNRYRPHYICKCECGKEVSVRCQRVLEGQTKSCGCLNKEVQRERLTGTGRHNQHYKTRLYRIYIAMKDRCYNESHERYFDYGGRGITICDEWIDYENGFNEFYDWAINNGYDEDLTIDRIENNKGYSPDNCRWVTMKTQSNNKSNNKFVTYEQRFDEIGKPPIRYTFTIAIWAEIIGIHKHVLRDRLIRWNMTVEDALTKIPTKSRNPIKKSIRKMIIVPPKYLQYNRPDKYEESIHD